MSLTYPLPSPQSPQSQATITWILPWKDFISALTIICSLYHFPLSSLCLPAHFTLYTPCSTRSISWPIATVSLQFRCSPSHLNSSPLSHKESQCPLNLQIKFCLHMVLVEFWRTVKVLLIILSANSTNLCYRTSNLPLPMSLVPMWTMTTGSLPVLLPGGCPRTPGYRLPGHQACNTPCNIPSPMLSTPLIIESPTITSSLFLEDVAIRVPWGS